MASEQNSQENIIKSSNIGFVAGVLIVALVVMFIVKSGVFKRDDSKEISQVETSNFEVIDEPESDLLEDTIIEAFSDENIGSGESKDYEYTFGDEDEVMIEEIEEMEDVDTHSVEDTAIGDNIYVLMAIFAMGGYGLMQASKKIA